MLLLVAGCLLHAQWLGSRRLGFLWAGQAAYALGMLEYEAVAFLPAAMGAALLLRRLGRGEALGRAARAALKEMFPFIITLAVVLLYQRLLVPALIHAPRKSVQAGLGHAFTVYWAGLKCVSSEVLRLAWDSVKGVWNSFSPGAWLAWLPVSVLLAAWFDPERSVIRAKGTAALAATAVVMFLVALIPYAISGIYTPRMIGVVNRVNHGSGIAAGLALAALLVRLPGRWKRLPLRRTAVAAVLALCVICHWDAGWRWSRAWEAQRSILGDIESDLPPENSTILLYGTPASLDGAPVFSTHYDLAQALWLRTGRRDLKANWVHSAFLQEKSVSIVNGDGQKFSYGYDGLYLYSAATRRLGRLAGMGSLGALGLSGVPAVGRR